MSSVSYGQGGKLVDLTARLPRGGGAPRRGRGGRWVRRAAALVAVGGVVAAATLRVERVRVVGARWVAPELVARYAALRGGERILLTRLGPVRGRVASIPGVQRASVRRVLPSTVVIEVVERRPLCRLDGRAELAVDGSGVVFPAPPGLDLPVLAGWGGRAAPGRRVDAGTRRLLRAFGGFPRELREATERVEVGGEVVLRLGGGVAVLLGRAERLGAKAAAATVVLRDARARGLPVASVDVRVPGTPVVAEREGPQGAPPAAPRGPGR